MSRTLETSIELSGVLSPSLQKAMNSAVSGLNKMSAETMQAASAGEKLAAKIRQQETELQQAVKAYADYALGGEEGSEEAQQLAQQIDQLSSEIDENKSELQNAYAAVEKLATGFDKTGNATEQLEGTIKQQDSTLQQLKRRYVELQLSEGDTTDESRQLAQQIEKLSTELQENKVKMAAAEQAADKLDHSLEDADQAARKAEDGFTVFKGALANLAADAIRSAIQGVKNLAGNVLQLGQDFGAAMSEVGALSGASGEQLEQLEATARQYGATTVFSATQAAEALKYMSLAGWDANQSTAALPGVLNLAAASGMELGAASDMVTDYLSAFSMEAQEASYMADLLAYAQANSNTSAEQLGGAYKNCAANLNAAGQDIETVTSMLEAMANQGLKGEKAGTAMAAIMRDITKGMKDGAIQIGDTSIAVQDAQGNYRDLTAILQDVEAATNGMGSAERAAALSSTFTADSTKGLNLLLNEGMDNIAGYEEALRGSAGAAEEMAETMNDNLAGDLKNMNSAWEELQLKIYDKAEPAMRKIVQTITDDVIPAATWLLNHLPELGVVISALSAVIIAAKWEKVVAGLGYVKKGFMGIATALGGVGAPVLAIIAIVAALALAFMHLWRTNEEFRNKILAIWDGLKEAFAAFTDGIVQRLNDMGFEFTSITDVIKAVWEKLCAILAPLFEGAFSAIASILQGALTILTGLFDVFAGIFTGDWSQVWNGIKTIFSGVWQMIVGVLKSVLGVIKSLVSAAWGVVKNVTASIWNSIVSTIKTKLANAKAAVSSVLASIKATITSILTGALASVRSIFSSIYSSISSKINAAKSAVSSAISAIKSAMHFSWSLPHLKLPHVSVSGKFSLNPPSAPHFSVSYYKEGGILTQPTAFGAAGNRLLVGGEAGAEAVLPLSKLWDELDRILNSAISAVASYGRPEAGLIAQAGQLLTMDNFSLGSLAGGGGIYVNYDFSGFTWAPTVKSDGGSESGIMNELKAHEAEFFDWLEEFISMREVAQYA